MILIPSCLQALHAARDERAWRERVKKLEE